MKIQTSRQFLSKLLARRQRRLAAALATASVFVGSFGVNVRADDTWTGGGATPNWSDSGNWNNGLPTTNYGTLYFSSTTNSPSNDDLTQVNQNALLFNVSGATGFEVDGTGAISLFDNGGTQAKIENNAGSGNTSGVFTLNNSTITYAATSGAAWGEINAVTGNILFGTSNTLNVTGSQVAGIRMFGAGETTTFNNTVNATGKYFATTATSADTVNVGGAFTSGDFYLMNGSTLNVSGSGFAATAVRLGGDFSTTGTQNLALGATFNLADAGGGQTYAGTINPVSGNTSGALAVNSQNTSGTNTLSGGIFLDSSLTISQAAGGTLAITGGTDLKAQTLTLSSAGAINVTGALTNSVTGGSLVKTGAGTVTFSNAGNNYSGATTVGAGTLSNGVANALPTGTALTVGNGTASATPVYDLAGFNQTVASLASNIGTGGSATVTNSSATAATLTVNGTSATTYAGVISGSLAFVKQGASTLTLTGTSTYTGGTTITTGSTIAATNGTSIGATANTLTFQGGTLTNNAGTNPTFALGSSTAASNGTVTVASGQTGTINLGSRFQFDDAVTGAGTLNLVAGTTVTREDFQNNFVGFTGTLNITGSGGIRLGIVSLSTGQPNFNAGGWINTTLSLDGASINPTTNSTGNVISIGALTSTGSTGTLVGGTAGAPNYTIGFKNLSTTYGGAFTGNAAITKTGTGTLILSDAATANTLTGAIAVRGGVLQVGAGSTTAGGFSAGTNTLTFNGTGTFNYVSSSAGSSQTLGAPTGSAGEGTILLTNNGSGSSTLTLAAPGTRGTGASLNFVVSGSNAANSKITDVIGTAGALANRAYYYNGSDFAVYDSTLGAVRAPIYGTDTNTSAVNTVGPTGYTNKFTATPTAQATISLANINLSGSGVSFVEASGATLTLTGGVLKSGGGSTSTISGGAAVAGSGEFVARTDTSSDVLDIQVPLTTATSLNKNGAGTLTLSAASTYTGTTYINAGTLKVDTESSTSTAKLSGTTNLTIQSSGTLLLANSGGATSTDRINNAATVTLNGNATINTGGLQEGTATGAAAATAGLGALTLANISSTNSTLDFGAGHSGSSVLVFAASNAATWSGTLTLLDFTPNTDFLNFSSSTGLTATQLGEISLAGYTATGLDSFGDVLFTATAVPEPTTYLGGALLVGVAGWSLRRRHLAIKTTAV